MAYPYQLTSEQEYRKAYAESIADPEKFWSAIASHFKWHKKWDQVLQWDFKGPDVKWFSGGKLNITENCLDRHLKHFGDRPAIVWEPNDPADQQRIISYSELHKLVVQFALVLRENSVKKGDRVCIYMGMIPEMAIAVLACARIGAIHSVIFGGFSAQSIAGRMEDAGAAYMITCDGAHRGEKHIPLKDIVDEALEIYRETSSVIVFKRTGVQVKMAEGRDLWWHDEVARIAANGDVHYEPESMDSEDVLFILYTSGSTGKPKGVVHTVAGYMVWANYTFVNVFQYKPGQVYFCTADIGWITGHSYIIYGPLSAGATTLMFEGVPVWPDPGRFWKIVEKYKVDILYTAPTAIRSLMACDPVHLNNKELGSLKVLGTVGEPINEEAWKWYFKQIGKERCPVVDTWWQTETGGIMISNLAGVTKAKPAFATLPLPGVQPCIVDENGIEKEGNNVGGNLCIKFPWPGMIRTTYRDHERCRKTYFATYPGKYFTGDGCIRDNDGNYRITGRVDDVLNVSAHRLGTAEIENAINLHEGVTESAVVGFPHEFKGQGIYAFVICDSGAHNDDQYKKDIMNTVAKVIGPIARPDKIQFVPGLPKTRSGKIMRRILRKIAEGDMSDFGDTSTLLDPGLVDLIRSNRV